MKEIRKSKGSALIPFLIFIVVYLFTGIYMESQGVELAFYQLPAPVAALVGIIAAFILFEGSVDDKFDNFVKGVSDENIIIMCLIYILAGAFSAVASASGGVESAVNLGLTYIPPQFMTGGMFIIAAFISLAAGTSVGTIIALGAIAVGLAEQTSISTHMMLGSLMGGAMFGDNLSIISDTTIAATRTQNVEMKDKFRTNIKIALPSAVIAFILFIVFGRPDVAIEPEIGAYSIVEVLPYLFVLISALAGVNVFIVLTGGIIFSGLVLLSQTGFDFINYAGVIYEGFEDVYEIFLLSMLIGGLSHMVTVEGGVNWVIEKITSRVNSRKSAELGIAGMVSLADIAVANNTVAIIITGPIAKELSNEYKVDPRRTASLLDTFSCVFQGLVPYGAQLLIAAEFTGGAISPIEIMPYMWYQFILAIMAILSIYIDFAKPSDQWDFENDRPLKENV